MDACNIFLENKNTNILSVFNILLYTLLILTCHIFV